MQEEERYLKIIEKYQQLLQNQNDPEIQFFVANELLRLMHELETAKEQSSLLKQIIQNIMILLMSLFQKKDISIEYQNFSELTDCQRKIIQRQLKPVLFNNIS